LYRYVEGDVTAEAVVEEIAAVAGGAGTVPELAAAVAAFVAKPNNKAGGCTSQTHFTHSFESTWSQL
jgi:hypothetical protein